MKVEGSDGAVFHHRARLFPLPYDTIERPSNTSSARIRYRFRRRCRIIAIKNRCINRLNQLYGSSSYLSPPPSHLSRPDNHSLPHESTTSSTFVSSAQRRVLDQLHDRVTHFVERVRTRSNGSSRDISTEMLDASMASSVYSTDTHSTVSNLNAADSLERAGWPVSSIPLPPSSYSTAATSVVPLIADRISLPERLNIVPMLDVLPPIIGSTYTSVASPTLLRPAVELLRMNASHRLKPPRVAGNRLEYVKLLRRLVAQGMVGFTSRPKAINGVFAVAKDADSDRLIIDAQPANRLFIDSPHVALPNPSHLVQLSVPRGRRMFVGKSDLSNFYHHIGMPKWMQAYFALPPLSRHELIELGVDATTAYPMCLTLPMGFSHAVYIAQSIHEHIVYRDGVLNPTHGLLCLASPAVTDDRVLHGIVIDDFFLFSLDLTLAERTMDRVLASYRRAGFVVKQSKVVMPTSDPVKVIGFEIDGDEHTINLPADSALGLVQSTAAALRVPTVSGSLLAHIIGRWTWVMMLRRPTLCVLQHVYRYSEIARGRSFVLWPSVRRELCTLIDLLPLMHARLDANIFHRALASDASTIGGGVVSTPLTMQLHSDMWPLCSNRHRAIQQAITNAQSTGSLRLTESDPTDSSDPCFDAYYAAVAGASWRTIISTPWSGEEHINTLELRAALLAVHWCLSYPSALHSRVYLLLDSTVAFFALWKGRSSSPKMLMVIRKINALLLAGDIALLPGWLPSAFNPADGPSRLRPDERPQGSLAA